MEQGPRSRGGDGGGHDGDADAVRAACRIVGVDPPAGASVQVETLSGDVLPFLGESLAGRRAYRVTLTQWQHAPAPRMTNLGALTLWLLDGTFQLVKATASASSPGTPRPATAEEARQLGAASERYLSLPVHAAQVRLLSALQTVATQAPGDTASARQLVAYYVQHRTVRYADRAVWILDVRGIHPFIVRQGVPESARDHLRHVVDGQSGAWLSSDTTPQPSTPVLVAAR